jgi:phosphatidate phosphatase LPIN
MKIGEAGEAFFLFETEDEIGEELATSPLQSPVLGPADASDEKSGASKPSEKLTDEKLADELVFHYLDPPNFILKWF